MKNVSSNATFFLKYCVPTVWLVFFGTLTLFILTNADASYTLSRGPISPTLVKLLMVGFLLSGFALLYMLVIRLKRVEMDEHFIYVTNYIKTFKYPYHNIEKLQPADTMLVQPVTVYFKAPGYFGKKITFLANRQFMAFLKEHPDIAKLVDNE